MNASGIFYAVGVVFSIVGATLGLLVLLYWAMLYTEQFEILVLTPTGEVNARAVPWLAILLYLFGRGMRLVAGERFTPSQTLIKLVSWPAKYCGTHYAMKVMGWQSISSPALINLWMQQHGLDWCFVAYLNNNNEYSVAVLDLSDIEVLSGGRPYWVYTPLSSASVDATSQGTVLCYQLNALLSRQLSR
jgi:hypothetical protein